MRILCARKLVGFAISVLSASARMDIRSLCPIAPSTEKSSGFRCSEATETKYRLLPALPCASPCGRIHFLRAVIEILRRTRPFFHSGSVLPVEHPPPQTHPQYRRPRDVTKP